MFQEKLPQDEDYTFSSEQNSVVFSKKQPFHVQVNSALSVLQTPLLPEDMCQQKHTSHFILSHKRLIKTNHSNLTSKYLIKTFTFNVFVSLYVRLEALQRVLESVVRSV